MQADTRLTAFESASYAATETGSVSQNGCRVEVLQSADAASQYREGWQGLSDNAIERNIFYEPWNLLPALNTVARGSRPRLLFIFKRVDSGDRLIGFFPFEERSFYKAMPIRHLRLLRHLHCFLCTPLVDKDFADDCLQAFSDWLSQPERHALIEFPGITTSMRSRLQRKLEHRPVRVTVSAHHDRAFFRRQQDGETYLNDAMTGKKRKDLRRKLRRLAECGDLEYRRLQRGEDARRWIDRFLELECRGWKGRARTALACNPLDRRYFIDSALQAHEQGKLEFVGYFLDGSPVALSCKYLAGRGAFSFKITFDEAFARYSPGMLLEMHYIVLSHEEDRVGWMDSCAEPGHRMANRLWIDRCGVDTALVSRGNHAECVRVLSQAIRALRRRLRKSRQLPSIV